MRVFPNHMVTYMKYQSLMIPNKHRANIMLCKMHRNFPRVFMGTLSCDQAVRRTYYGLFALRLVQSEPRVVSPEVEYHDAIFETCFNWLTDNSKWVYICQNHFLYCRIYAHCGNGTGSANLRFDVVRITYKLTCTKRLLAGALSRSLSEKHFVSVTIHLQPVFLHF